MVSFIGIDSTNFFRQGRNAFKAPLGVGIEVEDYDGFDKKYRSIIDSLVHHYGIETNRKCLKSHYIYEKKPEHASSFGTEFTKQIIPFLKNVYVMHTILNQAHTPEILCYNGAKIMTVNEFVPLLQSYYVHIVTWKILNDFNETKQSTFFLDHFTGSITPAWEEIENENLLVFSGGEYCNPLISTADIISKHITDYIHINRKKLEFAAISSAFNSFQITEINNSMDATEVGQALQSGTTKLYQRFVYDLSKITPSVRRSIDVDRKLKHPVHFILTSKKLPKEKEALEMTPLYDIITNNAYSSQGCVRSLNIDDLTNEVRYMRDGDHIVTVGNTALENAKYLVNELTGLSINVVPSAELLKG